MHEVEIPVTIGKPKPAAPCEKSHCGCESQSPHPSMSLSPLDQAKANTADKALRAALIKRGKLLQYVTIAYTSLEATVALISGTMSCSIALIGFGLDSAIEVTSGLASLYRLRTDGSDIHRNAELISLKITGWCFIALAAYVGFEAISALLTHEEPSRSIPGLILAMVSVVFMPWLARAKKAVANKLQSRALETDSKQALFCSYLSAILLAGLVLNATLHWWWADSAAALVMVPLMAREGILALRGHSCCSGETSCQ